MQILRITNIKIIDSSNIDVTFTDSLTANLTTSNISITSESGTAPNSTILLIKISGNLLLNHSETPPVKLIDSNKSFKLYDTLGDCIDI